MSIVPGHSAPTAGFEVPLEMLSACHYRIQRQCATLRRLVEHLATRGVDDDARTAAAGVVRYFDTAGRHHHDDEEMDLFPALVESMAGSDAVCLREITEALESDHRALDGHWQGVRAALEGVIAGDGAALAAADVESLVTAYERHIEREEAELLPMAARLLSDESLQTIGRAMRRRRGIEL